MRQYGQIWEKLNETFGSIMSININLHNSCNNVVIDESIKPLTQDVCLYTLVPLLKQDFMGYSKEFCIILKSKCVKWYLDYLWWMWF